jgi:diguanylate cyclase (GGDEF)-like protein
MDAERDHASTICSLITRLRLRLVPAAVAVAGLVALRWASAGSAPLDDAWQLGSAAVAAAACLWRGTRTTGLLRRAWVCIGLGCAGWAGGQGVWMAYELGMHRPTPFPSLADAGFVAFPVGMLAGITAFPVLPDRARRRDALDGAILALTLLAISWTVGLQPVVGRSSSVVSDAVALAYPLANVAVVTTALLVVGRARRHRRALLALAVAVSGVALSDAAFTYAATRGGYAGGGWTSTGWILAFATIAVASTLRPRRGSARRPAFADALVTSRTLRRHAVLAVLPYVPLAATVAVAGVAVLHDGRIDPVAALLIAGAVTLTLVRQFLTVRDNQLLLARVAQQQEALERQAYRDPLTGLANRTRFVGELEAALAGDGPGGAVAGGVGVLFCDLDDFKSVNDGLGHGAGDALLADVAGRLADAVAGDGLLARLGGDEFAVLVRAAPGDDVEDVAGTLAERVTRVVQAPFAVGDRPVRVGISVGLAVVPAGEHPTAADAALSRADVAMYTAKRSTDRRPVLWTPGLALPEAQDWRILPALDQALAAGTLPAHYQPVVDLGTGTVTGFEALARWPEPADRLTPADFLPVAVRSGLIRTLTAHMVGTAARQLATWIDGRIDGRVDDGDAAVHRPLRVSVNVSPSELVDPGLLRLVEPLVTELALPAGSLVLEVTEDALLEDGAAAARAARALHGLGVHVALDDFGSGYSALAHLTRVPFDVLKLDRQLVRDADRSPASRTLLRGVVALAGELALSVVAEGVERPSQAEVLLDLGCTLAQGYLFAPALPAQEVDLRPGAYAKAATAEVRAVDAVPQQR